MHDLDAAYRQTIYRVYMDSESFDLRIHEQNPAFTDMCKHRGISQWAIITAYNPFSQCFGMEENNAANADLKRSIEHVGLSYQAADGIPADSSWQTEKSFFIWNITCSQAIDLGKKYQQNAIVISKQRAEARSIDWLLPELLFLV